MNLIIKESMTINLSSPIIVTGSSKGIGKELISKFNEKNIKTIGISRSGICDSSISYQAEINDFLSLKKIYKDLKANSIYPEALINCAGIASMNLAITTPFKKVNEIIQTNLIGTIYSCQIFSPLLIKAKYGRIINFSTIAVNLGLKGESVYVASKAGVEAFSTVLAKELADFKITVNCIAPGPIRTDLLKGLNDSQIGKIIERQIIKKQFHKSDIVKTILLLLNKDSDCITGEVLNIGGF